MLQAFTRYTLTENNTLTLYSWEGIMGVCATLLIQILSRLDIVLEVAVIVQQCSPSSQYFAGVYPFLSVAWNCPPTRNIAWSASSSSLEIC